MIDASATRGLHTLLARAESRRGRRRESAALRGRECSGSILSTPEAPLESARELIAAGETGKPREALKSLLKDQPRHKAAGELLRQIDRRSGRCLKTLTSGARRLARLHLASSAPMDVIRERSAAVSLQTGRHFPGELPQFGLRERSLAIDGSLCRRPVAS